MLLQLLLMQLLSVVPLPAALTVLRRVQAVIMPVMYSRRCCCGRTVWQAVAMRRVRGCLLRSEKVRWQGRLLCCLRLMLSRFVGTADVQGIAQEGC